jgi:serine/threonine-protein kinase RsbW
MRSFNVPIKNFADDYIQTENIWLNIAGNNNNFRFLKKDSKLELLLAATQSSEAMPFDADIPKSNLTKSYDFLNRHLPDFGIYYINSYEGYVIGNSQKDIYACVFKRKEKKVKDITRDEGKIKIEMDDVIVCFNRSLSEEEKAIIAETINLSKMISYALIYQIEELIKTSGWDLKPVFSIDFSQHQAYMFPIKSSLKTVSTTIEMIKNKVLKHHTEKIWQIETVLHEALVNAITYGNELNSTKQVSISYEVGGKGVRIIIKDEGSGFDVEHVSVPVGEEALERISGRGIYIMQKFSDAIFYNKTGNEVAIFFNF